jgi:dTDP-4-dehydrorhamnose reductase
MKIQVFGPRGMLGSAVVKAITGRGHTWVPNDVDLAFVHAADIHAPVVINCAGLVKQRRCLPSRLMAVNAVGPHRLAEACDTASARLIQVSTDCVFQGPGPHAEWDATDCEDEYARSKLAGEVYRAPHLTIRTSFVGFGSRGLLRALLDHQTVRASDRLLWSGHTVDTIADVLVMLAEHETVIGLLHTPGEFQSRWELCNALIRRYNVPTRLIRDDDYEADRRLVSHAWDAWLLPELPSFTAQLEMMEWRT